MAYSLISHRADSLGLSGGTTGSFNSTRSDLIVVAVGYGGSIATVDASMITDNKGNDGNYIALTGATTDNHGNTTRLFYIHNPLVGPGHTITITTAPSGVAAAVACFKGSSTSPFDVEAGFGSDQGISTINPGSINTSEDDELIISAVCPTSTGQPFTVNGGLTILDTVETIGGVSNAISIAYRITTTATTVNPTWGVPFSRASAVIAAFKDNAPEVTRTTALAESSLELLFNGTTYDNIAKNATSSPLTNLEVSLHTADPGDSGDQTTHEITYTGYARSPVLRSAGGWTIADDVAQPIQPIVFPTGSGGSGTATFFGVGTDHTGAGRLLYSGPLEAGIVCGNGVTPALGVDTRIGAPIIPSIPFGVGVATGVASASADAKNDIGHGTAAGLATGDAPSNNRIGTGLAAGTCLPRGVTPGDLTLLGLDDFLYLGYYDFQPEASNTSNMTRLTHRYVDGHFRLLTLGTSAANMYELSVEGMSYGDLRFTYTNIWDMTPARAIPDVNLGNSGIWWDAVNDRLLFCSDTDYANQTQPSQLRSITLNSTATINTPHVVALEGVDGKKCYGGFDRNPAWFRAQYSLPEYICGWGGYSSLVAVGASMGPAFFAIPEILNYTTGSTIPATDFKILSDCAPTGANDWYADVTQTFDRGVRLTRPLNYFDGGDPRSNPSTRPTDDPLANAGWLSPAPDGQGRWVFGDSYFGTGCWIDTGTKAGFVACLAATADKGWYQSSAIHCDGRISELHIYDPIHMGEVALGSRAVWDLKPTSILTIPTPGQTAITSGTAGEANACNGMTYDSTTKKLYLLNALFDSHIIRIHVYSVGSGVAPTPQSVILHPHDGDSIFGKVTMYAGINCDPATFASGIVIYFKSQDHTISDSGAEMTYPVPFQRQIDTTLFPNGVYEIISSDHHNSLLVTVTVVN